MKLALLATTLAASLGVLVSAGADAEGELSVQRWCPGSQAFVQFSCEWEADRGKSRRLGAPTKTRLRRQLSVEPEYLDDCVLKICQVGKECVEKDLSGRIPQFPKDFVTTKLEAGGEDDFWKFFSHIDLSDFVKGGQVELELELKEKENQDGKEVAAYDDSDVSLTCD